jgi:transcriptional regulator with XRE-family HTH domain
MSRVSKAEQEFPKDLATAIRIGREEQGLTQKELAKAITGLLSDEEGREPTNIASWVSKAEQRANPNLGRLAALFVACRLPPSLLMSGIVERNEARLVNQHTHNFRRTDPWHRSRSISDDCFVPPTFEPRLSGRSEFRKRARNRAPAPVAAVPAVTASTARRMNASSASRHACKTTDI